MDELQLVGYTADMQHLVFANDADARRFKVPIDSDLAATLREIVGLADPSDDVVALLRLAAPAAPAAPAVQVADEDDEDDEDGSLPPGEGGLAGAAVLLQRVAPDVVAEQRGPSSKLSPREIQALLRAGRSTKAVAREAEIDETWVRRWLPPIEAERERVLDALRLARVEKTRLGPSADLLGDAVRRNLHAKGVHPDDEVRWNVSRRDGDPHWVVELRYRSRGKERRAVWWFDAETGVVEPRNDLAVEIAWTRAGKKAAGKKAAGKKAAGKKAAGKKAAGKKAAGKKAAGKKAVGKKAANKAVGRKAVGRKAVGKKAADKAVGRKAVGKKTVGKKAAKKAVGKKAAGRRRTGPGRR